MFVFNSKHILSNVTAIDAQEGKVLGKIELGGNPEFAASDGKGHVFVDLVDKDVVLQIDRSATLSLFEGCGNKQRAVLNATIGQMITTVPIGEGDDGTGTVIHEDSPDAYSVLETLKTEVGARIMAVDTKTHEIYLPPG